MKKILSLLICLVIAVITYGQSPSSFKYQAVLRDSKGNIKVNASATIIISILQGSSTGTVVYSETHSATTDSFGLINLEIGKGTVNSGTFSGITWSSGTFFVKVTVDGVEMGTTQLLSVPFALYATKAGNGFSGSYTDLTNKPSLFDGAYSSLTGKPNYSTVATSGSYTDLTNKPAFDTVSHLSVKGKTSDLGEALFEVKNKNGQTVFAVYNEGVRVYVDDGAKGTKGGFAIGGFGSAKAPSQNYFVVSGDSIRAYINESASKGTKGGFAIGGFGQSKGSAQEFLRVTPDSTRISFNEPEVKGSKGGFAIGELASTKGSVQDLLTINLESIRMYIDENPSKGSKGGFAIGGFSNSKGAIQEFLRVTSDSTRIFFNETPAKGSKGGFAIGGFSNSKSGSTNYVLINPYSSNFYVRSQGSKGDIFSSFNIMSFDPTQGWSSLMNANPDTISMSGVLNVENDFAVEGNIAYSGTVARDTTPTVTTNYVYDITKTTAIVNGEIVSNGGTPVIVSGVCWSTSINPTIAGNKTKDGEPIGNFESTIPGLTVNTKYFVRAYATNRDGTAYGDTISFRTAPDIPALSTLAVNNITTVSANSGGNIVSDGGSPVFERGVCWSTAHNPTINDSRTYDEVGSGEYASSMTGLTDNTAYYVRAYATNNAGTAYGNELSFSTIAVTLPTISTLSISNISTNSATSGGLITNDGGSPITDRGICWSTTANPTTAGNISSEGTGTGSFPSNLSGLAENTTYHIRAYAINSKGTAYGNEVIFTTNSSVATVTDIDGNIYNTVTIGSQTWIVENLKTTKFSDGTVITPVTDGPTWSGLSTPGYCWYNNDAATNKATYGALYNWYALDPTANGGKNVCPTGWHVPFDGEWTILTDYLGGETNAGSKLKEIGIAHWQSPNSDATNETGFTALPGGVRNYLGPFMQQGNVGNYWSLTESSAPNAFFRNLNNNNGTAARIDNFKKFGMSVRCLQGLAQPQAPSVITAPASAITDFGATTGGNVVNAGGSAVTERGVCYSINPNPTIADSKTSDGTGTGNFSSNLTGLDPATTYFIRAYATNNAGTAYGNEQTFTTNPVSK